VGDRVLFRGQIMTVVKVKNATEVMCEWRGPKGGYRREKYSVDSLEPVANAEAHQV
jgi:hypothetical protein